MTEVFLTGVGLLALIANWKWVWLPTVLDSTRDELFDLRDNFLREFFVKRGMSLDHPIYVRLRELLNGHLRHTESLSFGEYMFTVLTVERNQELSAKTTEAIERRFRTKDPELQKLVDEIRIRSGMMMVCYMIETSIACMTLALCMKPILRLRHLSRMSVFGSDTQARKVMEQVALAPA